MYKENQAGAFKKQTAHKSYEMNIATARWNYDGVLCSRVFNRMFGSCSYIRCIMYLESWTRPREIYIE